jgi:hypothetical protein
MFRRFGGDLYSGSSAMLTSRSLHTAMGTTQRHAFLLPTLSLLAMVW